MDILRGFAILAVIAIHVTMSLSGIPLSDGLLLALIPVSIFPHFAVPLFIFISGFVLSRKYPGGFSLELFYKKRAASVVPQYLAFSILYIAGRLVLFGPVAAGTILLYLLTASSSYHLWFFAVIIELYLLYPLISGIYRRFDTAGRLPLLFLSALALQLAWDSLLGTFAGTSLAYMFAQRVFLSQLFYFILGIYAAKNYGRIKTSVQKIRPAYPALSTILATGAISLAGAIILKYDPKYELFSLMTLRLNFAPRLFQPVLYVSAFILCLKSAYWLMEKRGSLFRAFSALGKYSFGIYLIHVLFIILFIKCLGMIDMGPAQWLFYPVLYITVLAASYASVYLLSYLPASTLIIGTHNKIKKEIIVPAQT